MGEPTQVLHVDDEADFLDIVKGRLEQVEPTLSIDTANSVDEALDRLDSNTYDCVVSDYDMPDSNGIEFLQQVRRGYGDLPFILFTGKGGEAVASEAIAHDVTDYLQKRISDDQFDLLANRIQNAASRYRAEQALSEHVRQLETLVTNLPGIAYRCQGKHPWTMESIRGDCELLTGYPATDFVDGERTWGDDVIHHEDREHVMNKLASGLASEGSFEIRYRIVTADGGTKWVWESGQEVGSSPSGTPMLEGFVTDITGWYHHRERQRVLFEDAADAIVEVVFRNDTAIVERVNPAFESIFGVSSFEAVDRPVNDVIVPPEGQELAADIDERVNRGEIVEEELQRMTADGRRWFLLRTVPFQLGEEQRAYATYVDITSQMEREAAIEALHEATRSMFDLTDEPTIFEAAVDAAVEVLGLSTSAAYRFDSWSNTLVPAAMSDSFLSEGELEALPDGDTPVWRAFDEREGVLLDASACEALQLDRPGIAVESGLVVPIGTHGVLLSTASDPAAFDAADLRLAGLLGSTTASALDAARRESQLAGLHKAATEIGALDDPEAIFDRLIMAAEEILEFDFAVADAVEDDHLITRATSSAIDDTSFFEKTPVNAEDNIAAKSFRTGEPDLTHDLRELAVTPADPDFLSALTVPINGHGVFQAAAKRQSAFDEVDLEFAELLVSHAREALTRLERTQELEERTQELDRQNERLEQFASIVSHDLRNPLNVIAGRLELARDQPEGDHLAAIDDAVDRMEAIIEHTLALAREGRTVGETQPIDLESIATGCWARVATGDATLSTEGSLRFLGDPERVEQIFENLFRNAIEHGGEGITVRVGSVDTDGFYVADDGPGIPQSDRGSVFEPGYTTGEEGVGIGLSIITEIVDAHGWSVELTSSADGGARFDITGVEPVDSTE